MFIFAEEYPETFQSSNMKPYAEIVNKFKPLIR